MMAQNANPNEFVGPGPAGQPAAEGRGRRRGGGPRGLRGRARRALLVHRPIRRRRRRARTPAGTYTHRTLSLQTNSSGFTS